MCPESEKRMISSIMTCIIVISLFRISNSDRQVTFTCDGEGSGVGSKGDVGAPGKRGAEGPRGFPGPAGPKGDAADVTALEEQVRVLNETLTRLRHHLNRIPDVYHFRLSSTITWASSKEYCESLSLVLCEQDKVFHRNLPYGIGVQDGNHWVPIRDRENDWIQIGTYHPLALVHNQRWAPPEWGINPTNRSYKGNVFCCLE